MNTEETPASVTEVANSLRHLATWLTGHPESTAAAEIKDALTRHGVRVHMFSARRFAETLDDLELGVPTIEDDDHYLRATAQFGVIPVTVAGLASCVAELTVVDTRTVTEDVTEWVLKGEVA